MSIWPRVPTLASSELTDGPDGASPLSPLSLPVAAASLAHAPASLMVMESTSSLSVITSVETCQA